VTLLLCLRRLPRWLPAEPPSRVLDDGLAPRGQDSWSARRTVATVAKSIARYQLIADARRGGRKIGEVEEREAVVGGRTEVGESCTTKGMNNKKNNNKNHFHLQDIGENGRCPTWTAGALGAGPLLV